MNRLSAIRAALLDELGDAGKLHFVNTRLILTAGVDLNGPDKLLQADRARLEKAVLALHKMGFLRGKEVRRG